MDTFATNENLIAAGITPERAKVITTAIAEAVNGVMDTLATNEKLIAADFTPKQAKAITTAIAEAEYVTKAD